MVLIYALTVLKRHAFSVVKAIQSHIAYVPRLCPREPWLQFLRDISVWLDPADMPREVGDRIGCGT